MPTAIPVFNFRNVYLGWGGLSFVDFGEEGISVSPNNPAFTTTTMSADGLSNIAVNTDYSGMVDVNLMAGSPTNRHLAGLVNDTRNGSGILHKANMVLYDEAGLVPCLIKNAYIQNIPEGMQLKQDYEGNVYTWQFKCEELIWTYDLDSLPTTIIEQFREESEAQINIFASLDISI